MVVLTSLRRALAGLWNNPVLFVATGLLALLQVPSLVTGSVEPLLGALLSLVFAVATFLLVPLLQGGLVGMADEATDGRTRLRTLLRVGRAHYVSLLGAHLLLAAASIAAALVAAVVVLSLGIPLLAMGNPAAALSGQLVTVGLVVGLLGLLYLVVVLFVQFYAQAVVLDDEGAIDGFVRSVGVVRRNLPATVGFSLIAWAVGLVLGGIGTVASLVVAPPGVELVPLPTVTSWEAGVLVVVVVVANAASSAVIFTYSVSFYRAITTGP